MVLDGTRPAGKTMAPLGMGTVRRLLVFYILAQLLVGLSVRAAFGPVHRARAQLAPLLLVTREGP